MASTRDPQINIRIPENLKDMLHKEADFNNRSVNSEVVGMISEMLRIRSPHRDLLLNAEQARLLVKNAGVDEVIKSTLIQCASAINASLAQGEYVAKINHYWGNDKDAQKNLDPVKRKLESLGYSVTFEDNQKIIIDFSKEVTDVSH